jgi:hypothetical protein
MPPTFTAELAGLVTYAGQSLLGAIFLQAGLQKLKHAAEWHGVVANYQLLPEPETGPFAAVLPWAELLLAAGLWLGTGRAAAVSAAVLLMVFTIAIGVNLARGRSQIDCGCFQSSLRQTLNNRVLIRNGVLLAIAIGSATLTDSNTVVLSERLLSLAFGGACFALYLPLNELLVQGLPVPSLPSLKANLT